MVKRSMAPKGLTLFLIMLVGLSGTLLFAGGQGDAEEGSSGGSGAAPAGPEYVIDFATGNAPTEGASWWEPYKLFAEEVERRSDGRIECKLYPNAQLGDFSSVIDQVQAGIIQAAEVPDGNIATIYPPIQVFSIPYLFDSREHAFAVMDGPFGQEMMDDLAEVTGLRVVRFHENGFRHITNSVREIRTPADLRGLKIRTMTSPFHMQIMQDLGADAVPIQWQEVYTALQTGVVDGQENSWSIIPMAKLDEVQQYTSDDGHVWGMGMVIFNEEWYQGLPSDLQRAVEESAIAAAELLNELKGNEVESALEYLNEKGMTVTFLTPEQKAMFRAAAQPSGIEYISGVVDSKWVNGVLEAADETRPN